MTHYLRNKSNDTIVDLEDAKDDVHCVVSVREYSRALLNLPEGDRSDFIADFDALQEIRGEWFEVEERSGIPLREFVERRMKYVAIRWNLAYVTD